jgi:hypothetical protein
MCAYLAKSYLSMYNYELTNAYTSEQMTATKTSFMCLHWWAGHTQPWKQSPVGLHIHNILMLQGHKISFTTQGIMQSM